MPYTYIASLCYLVLVGIILVLGTVYILRDSKW